MEVYDEETCLETMRGKILVFFESILIIYFYFKGYYETAFDQALPDECRCSLSGCEYDYVSNTYRVQVWNPKLCYKKFNSKLPKPLNSFLEVSLSCNAFSCYCHINFHQIYRILWSFSRQLWTLRHWILQHIIWS